MDACQLLGRGEKASWLCSCLNWLFVLLLPAFEQDEEANKLPEYSKFGQISVKGKAVSLPIGICFIMVSSPVKEPNTLASCILCVGCCRFTCDERAQCDPSS